MIIKIDTDQIKKIRDDSFECAAKLVEDDGAGITLADKIRAMKDSPVNVLVKGNKNNVA